LTQQAFPVTRRGLAMSDNMLTSENSHRAGPHRNRAAKAALRETVLAQPHIGNAPALPAKANTLSPVLSEQSAKNETLGQLSTETITALSDSGFFQMLMPACFGGAEVDPVEAMRIFEAVSYADGSTGWVLMATQICTGAAAAYLEPATATELF